MNPYAKKSTLGWLRHNLWWVWSVNAVFMGAMVVALDQPPFEVWGARRAYAAADPVADARWELAQPAIAKADADSLAAVEARLARIDAFFAECEQGTGPFAGDMLSNESALTWAGSVAEQGVVAAANTVLSLFDTEGYDTPDDRFEEFARAKFRSRVLDDDELSEAVKSAAMGLTGDLRAAEAKLLVSLRLDLPDGQLAQDTAAEPEAAAVGDLGGLVREVSFTTGGDLALSLAQLYVSDAIGNMVAGLLTELISQVIDIRTNSAAKLGVGFASDLVVDKAMGAILDSTGYDPQARVAALATKTLREARGSLVDGDPTAAGRYASLLVCRYGHGDPEVIDAAGAALAVMERSNALGLRAKMTGAHVRGSVGRYTIAHRLARGTAPPRFYAGDSRLDTPTPELLRLARECIETYREDRP